MSWSAVGLGASTLLASGVEFVEAFTIVLAMGVTRGWRSTLAGTACALVALSGIAAVSGYTLINWFPESALQLVGGSALHKPLARVPENTIKFAVGLLLSTFGTVWAVEGLGAFKHGSESVEWPGGDAFLLAILALWIAASWLAIRALSPYGKRR